MSTTQPHDRFAKEYLAELPTPFGTVTTDQKVQSEVLEMDVWFEPHDRPPQDLPATGFIQHLAHLPCLLEPYRNPVGIPDIRTCLLKLFSVQGDRLREAKRQKSPLGETQLPILWILTPTCSQRILQGFGATAEAPGIYNLPLFLRSRIVVIHQLPTTEETLWMRVLGRGRTQQRAVQELLDLPEEHPYKPSLLEILADWQKNLALRDQRNRQEEEAIMNLSPVYLQQREAWKQEARQEGMQEGIQEGLQQGMQQGMQQGAQEGSASITLKLLRKRFGTLPIVLEETIRRLSYEQLEALGDVLLDLPTVEALEAWLGQQT